MVAVEYADFKLCCKKFVTEKLFYVVFIFNVFTYWLYYTTFKVNSERLQLLILFLLFVKICFQKYSSSEIFRVVFFLFVGGVSYVLTGADRLFITMLFIIAGQGIDIKKLSKYAIFCQIIIIVMAVTCSLLGIIPNLMQETDSGGLRQSWGFTHPNAFGSIFMALACSIAIYFFPRYSFSFYVFLVFIGLIIFYIACSRTSAYCVAILVILCISSSRCIGRHQFVDVDCFSYSLKKEKVIERDINFILRSFLYGFIAIISLSVYFMVHFDINTKWMYALNEALSERLALMNTCYKEIGIRLFGFYRDVLNAPNDEFYVLRGSETNLIGATRNLVDNVYGKSLILYGIVPSIIFFSLYFAFFYKALKEKRFDSCVLGAFVYVIVGFAEWSSISFAVNYFLVGLASVIYEEKKSYICEDVSNLNEMSKDNKNGMQ